MHLIGSRPHRTIGTGWGIATAAGIALASIAAAVEPASLDNGLAHYRQNELEAARDQFQRCIQQTPDDPAPRAWYAETLRRLGHPEGAVAEARRVLSLSPCHAFAHVILASAYNPLHPEWSGSDADSTWTHLSRAVECDPSEGEAWLVIWGEAVRRGDSDREEEALRALIEHRFFSPAMLAYARWMLEYAPENAILLTNGDMDTYPPLAVQFVEQLRPDVAVVNLSMLNLPEYVRAMERRHGIPAAYDEEVLSALKPDVSDDHVITVSEKVVSQWLKRANAGTLGRPITAAVTVSTFAFSPNGKDDFTLVGPCLVYAPGSGVGCDAAAVGRSLSNLNPADFAGSFTTARDRSPVRVAGSDRIAINVTAVATTYAMELLERGRYGEAADAAAWADRFDRATKVGPVFAERLSEIKQAAHEGRE